MQDSNNVYVNMEYSEVEPLGAFFLITFIGIMAIQVPSVTLYSRITMNVGILLQRLKGHSMAMENE